MINLIPFQANLNSENIRLMSAMLCAALYPNVVQVYIHSLCHQNKKLKPVYNHFKTVPCLLSLLGFTLLCLTFLFQVRSPQGNYKMTSKGAMKMQPKANELRFMTKDDGCVHVHPSSVNYTVR